MVQDGQMLRGSTPGIRRERQHGAVLQQYDRRDLERAGWRTTLDYRENLIRGRDGRLLQVEPVWHAEAERSEPARRVGAPVPGGERAVRGVDFITATAETVDAVWSRLRVEAELADVRRPLEAGTDIRARAS
jgi:hypothetical protein